MPVPSRNGLPYMRHNSTLYFQCPDNQGRLFPSITSEVVQKFDRSGWLPSLLAIHAPASASPFFPDATRIWKKVFGSTVINEDNALMGVTIDIVAVLGTAEMKISQILQLGRGAVVELDRFVGEPVELRAKGRLVAKGEVIATDDKLSVQITEVVKFST